MSSGARGVGEKKKNCPSLRIRLCTQREGSCGTVLSEKAGIRCGEVVGGPILGEETCQPRHGGVPVRSPRNN